ncbi:G-protein alpha subunit-domain-containing protein [Phellopilus nigrolimitatus]|nr:G-protein alpha subunit-domain-containing protein [Phellopilus nigrolimitatus]
MHATGKIFLQLGPTIWEIPYQAPLTASDKLWDSPWMGMPKDPEILLGIPSIGHAHMLGHAQQPWDSYNQTGPPSVNLILGVLQSALAGAAAGGAAYLSSSDDDAPPAAGLTLSEPHKLLRLCRVQADLEQRLGSDAEELVSVAGGPPTVAAPFDAAASARRPQEFFVRSSTGWKSALDRLRPRSSSGSGAGAGSAGSREEALERARRERDVEESTGCCEDMHALSTDSDVCQMLTARRLAPRGYFLDDVQRVAMHDYEPTDDDDIVRAWLRTMGVQEYHFLFERGAEAGQEWLMYRRRDALSAAGAGAVLRRHQRDHLPRADLRVRREARGGPLREPPRGLVPPLEGHVCERRLAKTQLVLFLNKCDLLGKKLATGAQMRDYVPSFGDRSSTSGTVAKYLRTKFRDMSKNYSPEPRPIYMHLTSVIDTKATAWTLGAVRTAARRHVLRARARVVVWEREAFHERDDLRAAPRRSPRRTRARTQIQNQNRVVQRAERGEHPSECLPDFTTSANREMGSVDFQDLDFLEGVISSIGLSACVLVQKWGRPCVAHVHVVIGVTTRRAGTVGRGWRSRKFERNSAKQKWASKLSLNINTVLESCVVVSLTIVYSTMLA